jgi:hypothetical protein
MHFTLKKYFGKSLFFIIRNSRARPWSEKWFSEFSTNKSCPWKQSEEKMLLSPPAPRAISHFSRAMITITKRHCWQNLFFTCACAPFKNFNDRGTPIYKHSYIHKRSLSVHTHRN